MEVYCLTYTACPAAKQSNAMGITCTTRHSTAPALIILAPPALTVTAVIS